MNAFIASDLQYITCLERKSPIQFDDAMVRNLGYGGELPDRVHVVTSRDPRDWEDWKTEFLLPSRSRLRVVAASSVSSRRARERTISPRAQNEIPSP